MKVFAPLLFALLALAWAAPTDDLVTPMGNDTVVILPKPIASPHGGGGMQANGNDTIGVTP